MLYQLNIHKLDLFYSGFVVLHKEQMDIHALKRTLFNDLTEPIGFLKHRGFVANEPTGMQRFGDSVYFYNGTRSHSLNTAPSRVVQADIHSFQHDEHVLKLDCDLSAHLEKCAVIAHGQVEELKDVPFEVFWKHCHIPTTVELKAYAFSKDKVQKFISVYMKDNEEVTGTVQVTKNSIVCANVKPVLTITKHEEGRCQFGFKFVIGAGLKILKLSGNPPAIRRPWVWDRVAFDTLSVPLYDSVSVKTPSFSVATVQNSVINVSTPNEEFNNAMDEFHRNAGATPWDNSIEIMGRHKVTPGSTAIASIAPYRENNTIRWKTLSLHSSRPKKPAKEGGKRDSDTLGNPVCVQTKRQCI